MIAFTRQSQIAKMTTAHVAPTTQAVLPISSVRNVMAKVDSTAKFIERAREIHGDRYDYSKTVWNGAQNPITITCEKHGDFVLAQAQEHYRKNKSCGCRKCGCRDYRTCECGFVGYGKDFPQHAKGLCELCWKRQKQAKKEANKAICKHCEGKFQKKNGVTFCSRECRTAYSFANKKEYRKFECKVCGKQVEGWEWKAQNPKQVCSKECQLKLALVDNRGRLPKDWIKASLKAKAKWKRDLSAKRRSNNQWHSCITSGIASLLSNETKQDRWQVKCSSAFNLLSHRLDPNPKFRLVARKTWDSCIISQMEKIAKKAKRECQGLWMLKCETKARSLHRRRTLRNAR